MSSLAGALDTHLPLNNTRGIENDIEMNVPDQQSGSSIGGDDEKDEEVEMSDLFGNDQDVEETKHEINAASPSASGPESDRLPSPERERRQALEYEEEENPPEIAVEVKEADVSFPNIPVPRSSQGENWVVRMPNFVKVDSKPFHPDTYIGPEHEDEETHQAENMRERSMTIKLKVENTVRWRWTRDQFGQDVRQSNSRFIRWSDGSLSLRLGKELFDINQSIDTSAGVPRHYLGTPTQSQPSQQGSQVPANNKSQGLTYLVAQHKRSQVLQSEAVITGYMSLRPTGMQSETHRMLVRAVGQKHNKVARLRMAPDPTMDPEREKLELMKQSAKRSKKKSDHDDGFGGGRKKRFSRRTTNHDMWSDDDDEAGVQFQASEEEEDGISGGSARTPKRSSDKKGPEDYQEDDFVVADSSEDEGGTGRKRGRDGSEMEEDPLDKLDAKIREQQDASKRRRESGEKMDDEPEDENANGMDVESEEEDEDEVKVRRVGGTGTRKRTAISFKDDEEEE